MAFTILLNGSTDTANKVVRGRTSEQATEFKRTCGTTRYTKRSTRARSCNRTIDIAGDRLVGRAKEAGAVVGSRDRSGAKVDECVICRGAERWNTNRS